jgi:hypothetical protein
MEFGTGALKQVWYEIDHPFGNFPDQKKGWIAGRINDKNYIGTNGDPCASLPLPSEIRFPYDREAAARYAIEQGIKNNSRNSIPDGDYRVTQFENFFPFAKFIHNNLSYANATGSSMFTGESIWIGGLPMTRNKLDVNDSKCQNNHTKSGWRHCSSEIDASDPPKVGFTSQAWKDHNTQIAYYTVSSVINPSASNNILKNVTKGSCVNSETKKNSGILNMVCNPAVTKNNLSDIVNLDKGQVLLNISNETKKIFITNVLVKRVGESQLSLNKVSRGDYVWINTGGLTNHGLLVAGWGPLENCENSLKTKIYGYNDLLSHSPQVSWTYKPIESISDSEVPETIYIPFVVDYSYGKIRNQPPLQSTIPRPFYCTRFNEKGLVNPSRNRFSGDHSWWFFNLPEYVSVSPDLIYVDTEWSWTVGSR